MANTKQIQETELEVEVLYQKLGDRWFAFSIVNDEVFMAPVSDDQVAEAKREVSPRNIDFDLETELNETI